MTGPATAATIATAGFAAFSVASYLSVLPTNALWGPVHFRSADGTPRYALTFDDGPTPIATAAVLDTLGELGVRATFFVIGANVRKCPELVARMHAEGHLVANHSEDHHHLCMLRGRRYWDRQLAETDEIILQTIGVRPAMFRPPMGVKTGYVMGAARRRGQAVVTWSRRAMDGITTTSQRILDRLVPHTVAGDVLLLHDGVEPQSRRDPSPTVVAVKSLVLGLRARGLEPAPLDSFLQLSAYAPARTAAGRARS